MPFLWFAWMFYSVLNIIFYASLHFPRDILSPLGAVLKKIIVLITFRNDTFIHVYIFATIIIVRFVLKKLNHEFVFYFMETKFSMDLSLYAETK